jgi:tetratricopeptide (TPR) repeat protein
MTDRPQPTIGVAMIARNGAKTLKRALKPFLGLVDEMAIVFGGVSTDNTEAIAKKLATVTAPFTGPVDDNGRLLDFGAARQQSFDLLTTDWAVVVDTDDIWGGLDNLRDLVNLAHQEGADAIWVPYSIGPSQLHQPRIYRRGAGQWTGIIHEQYELDNPDANRIKSADLWIEQKRGKAEWAQRRKQNIELCESILLQNPDDRRAIALVVNDYLTEHRDREVITLTERYIGLWDAEADGYNDEIYYVLAKRAMAFMKLGQFEDAARTAVHALAIQNTATAWALLAEACHKQVNGSGSQALNELAVFCAERAMSRGKPRHGYGENINMAGSIPAQIKAMALSGLGRYREALGAFDLAVQLNPGDKMIEANRQRLCRHINEVP